MKILIVSWYFPPVNTIGALRVGAFARFLHEQGHEIRVVSGRYWGHPETLKVGVPPGQVTYAASIDINALPGQLLSPVRNLLRRRRKTNGLKQDDATEIPASSPTSSKTLPGAPSLRRRLSELYILLTNLPDSRVGWLPWAYAATARICKSWKPDLIFASGPPFTALLAARMAAARHHVPLVVELRDRWADDPYEELPKWRARIDDWMERRILTTARGIVTVTEPWGLFYAKKYRKPVATIYNGYDPRDFEDESDSVEALSPHLVIGYAGGIYPGRRDPTPLFEALKLLGPKGEQCRVIFCGTNPAHVWPLAERAGVAHLVEVRPGVPHKESLAFQRRAEILLLMQWNDPREQGNCPGKFFEYVASLRPVLVLGLEDGVPAMILSERQAGLCLNDPPRIAAQLETWLDQHQAFGRVPSLPPAAREGLSRTLQYKRLEAFLNEILAQPA